MDGNNQALTTSRRGLPIKLLILVFMVFMASVAVTGAFFSAQKISRDQIRVRDIQILQSFLTSYKNNHGAYPQAINGQPGLWQDYLDYLPQAPAADGSCTAAENNYFYSQASGGSSFTLSYCLGGSSSNIQSGPNTVGPI